MPNKMLIDASHPEETRVVVVRGNRIEEFDFESQDKKQLKGNIYLARVTRVEPSLQAAFVEYGGNRHGFLAFSEIHPDYYQIPVADRQALLRAEAEDAGSDDDDDEGEEKNGRNRRRRRGGRNRARADETKATTADDENVDPSDDAADESDTDSEADEIETIVPNSDGAEIEGILPESVIAESVEADVISEAAPTSDNDEDADDNDGESEDDHEDDSSSNGNGDDEVTSVGAEDALEEIREQRRTPRKHYKIQEVIKRRQILLVQVVKEERGNKGAALTTYLSLAGRYSVLMPNTARGGGISRKITNAQDRKRLKDVVKDLEVPQGMGVILRTAGESRTKAEIKRDYEYLMRLWDNVRTLTLQSSAPSLVYEEGSLIKRSVRDLYNKDINEILVAGDEGYREAKDFMRMLMPSHAKVVQPYREASPIFARNGIEAQLDKMLQPQVTLKSGGYIIINQTEALVSIDVNSGRSTKEHSIEDTALQTNLEAAEEVARQLRLRDLAGLIVIDFIDMEENRNNRAVEKKLKDCLKNDRARIQVGRISHFGLLEMSRQRIRASVLDSTTQPCPHCGGSGHIRSESSVGLMVIRAVEEFLLKDGRHHITVRTPTSTAIYVLNHKRSNLVELEKRFGLTITIETDDSLKTQHYAIFKGAVAENATLYQPTSPVLLDDEELDEEDFVEEDAHDEADAPVSAEQIESEGDDAQRKRKRRRRRRGGRDRTEESAEQTVSADGEAEGDDSTEASEEAVGTDGEASELTASAEETAAKKRRRGKRGGRRNRRDDEGAATAGNSDDIAGDGEGSSEASDAETQPAETVEAPVAEIVGEIVDQAAMEAIEAPSEAAAEVATEVAAEAEAVEKPKRRAPRRTAAKKAQPAEPEMVEAAADLAAESEVAPAADVEAPKEKPKRAPRRKAPAKAKEAVAEVADAVVAEEAAPAALEITAQASEPENTLVPETADVTPVPEAVVVATPVEEKPAEPVVTSSQGEQADKPRKGGWWQRKGFF